MFALSSGNVSKYELFNWQRCFTRKRLGKKAAATKRFEYSPLGKELKKQTNVAERQYQKFDKVFESNKKKEDKTKAKKVVLSHI